MLKAGAGIVMREKQGTGILWDVRCFLCVGGDRLFCHYGDLTLYTLDSSLIQMYLVSIQIFVCINTENRWLYRCHFF